MAQSAKTKTRKSSPISGKAFKDRLTLLGCPYTDGVDETWISELLFQPGEARIRLLQWCFSRYDLKLAKLLDDQCYGSEARVDSRIQKLLSISSMLGLCHPDDIDLIKGTASSSKQAAFWHQLLDVVSITDMSEDPHRKAESLPGIISDSTNLQEQFSHDCLFLSSLAHQRDLAEAFSTSHSLLPPDLMKLVRRKASDYESETGQRASPPSLEELDELLVQLNNNVKNAKEQLEDLKSKYPYQENPSQSMDTTCQTLKLVLSELAQLITSFTHTFETEIRPWCNKNPPRLTPLGPASKRVHNLLSQFLQLLKDLKSVRTSFKHLSDYSQNAEALQATSDTLSTIASISDSALHSYSDLTSILEETSHTGHTESVLQPFM
ncbi:HAUS augmin-like complex subunit 7 [Holothuria leucospilota]|uniref:HAUS augmin-like complex subunit 7 n=1 Tax=Holothuria leucospilota TaxID=206669 RepID=A0A9Q1HJW6_HOLLE|nr:HAUS augmin-like complex subunit 7 [Holothuria leucospilota]